MLCIMVTGCVATGGTKLQEFVSNSVMEIAFENVNLAHCRMSCGVPLRLSNSVTAVQSNRTRRRLIAKAQTGTKYGGGRNKYFHRPNSALSTPTCKLVELEVHNTLDKLHEAYHHSQTSRLNHLPDETPLNSSYIQRPKNSYKVCPSTSVNTFVQLPYRDIRINTLVRKATLWRPTKLTWIITNFSFLRAKSPLQ